ncbi:MAG: exodeoxyribonuclease VII large subunit [Flavobacteriales bacterium]
MEDGRKVHTLSRLTKSIRKMFDEHFDRTYWVKAEMVKLNHYPKSGHCYPDLVEKEGEKVKAEMRGTLWKDRYRRVAREFQKVTGQPLDGGIEVLFRAEVRFHEVYGLSLNIIELDPGYSLGEMERIKRETIRKLKDAGEFELNKKRPFPNVPKRLAIISVETSKGYQDLIKVLDRNQFAYVYEHQLFPAILQGEKAIHTIREQMAYVRERATEFDVLLIIRGGGGDVGLSCYDDHGLARDVAMFPLPVITGIGHSTNETVVEMLAHRNAITPTQAANELIQAYHNVAVPRQQLKERLERAVRDRFREEAQRLNDQAQLFRSHTRYLIRDHQHHLQSILEGAVRAVPERMRKERQRLGELSNSLNNSAVKRLNREGETLNLLFERMGGNLKYRLKGEKERVAHLERQIELLDPKRVLERGYSITFKDGKAVRDPDRLEEGEKVETRVAKGRFKSRIEKVKNDERRSETGE